MHRFPLQLRWAAPAAAVAAVAAVTAGSLIGVAQAAPALPSRTPAQLLAAVAGSATLPPPLTGTVVETASLGIPQLPGTGNPTSITSLLTGSHTVNVWYGGPRRIRLSVPVPLGETDLIRNGSTVWLWQSRTNSVTKYALPARSRSPRPAPTAAPLTPQQAARQVLAAVGPTTRVRAEANVEVAGQAAYQLVLVPRQAGSLISEVKIALDGRHPQLPLRVQVFARGAARTPAYQVGYTSLSFVAPAAANFDFRPPAGASVHTAAPKSAGSGGAGSGGAGGTSAGPGAGGLAPATAAGARVIGTGWLSVAVFPSSALSALSGSGSAASAVGQAARSASGGGGGVSSAALLAGLLQAARPVTGPWGTGRLLTTSLVSVLITSSGHVLAGAVTPTVLYAAAEQVK